ncbi:WxL domain-containing protein [Enterococcus sp. AZ192]|uniref:WxL domain-containing protein n=1 Tax=unclassified Enterococcus TaxID=2608891 RepID=UPI003D29DCF5
MKLTHKLCGAVLVAAAGVAIAAPSATQALEGTRNGTADIEFTKNTSEDTTMTDPTGTRKPDTGSEIDPTHVDEFGIIAVTPLDFSSHAAVAAGQSGSFYAKAHVANRGNADEYEVENYVAIKDVRSTTDHTYTLTAKLEKQFTAMVDSQEVTLNGATLTYSNIDVADTLNPGLSPADDKKVFGEAGSGSQTIALGETKPIYQNTDPNGGKGRYEVTFGDDAKGTEANSVLLEFGDNVDVRTAQYNATVLWTLTDGK